MTLSAFLMGLRLCPCCWQPKRSGSTRSGSTKYEITDVAESLFIPSIVVDVLGLITAVVLGILAAIGVIQISAVACFISAGGILLLGSIGFIGLNLFDIKAPQEK